MTESYASVVGTLTRGLTSSGFTQKRLLDISSVDAYAAIEFSTGHCVLLLEIKVDSAIGLVDWPRSEGFSSELRPLGKQSDRVHVCIQLTEPRYQSLFTVLVEDILEMLRISQNETDAVRACHERLWEWQIFFKKHGPEGLSDEARAGLYGELHLLENLLIPNAGPSISVRSWRGCLKANQDFQLEGTAIEAKATRSAVLDSVHISNVQQLENAEVTDLFLAVVHLQQSPSETETLPDAVLRIRESLPAPEASAFSAGLYEVGYHEAHTDLYEEDRYTVREARYYRVAKGFPRIRSENLPQGVRSVRYKIGLDACDPFRVEVTEVIAALPAHGKEHHGD